MHLNKTTNSFSSGTTLEVGNILGTLSKIIPTLLDIFTLAQPL
jgi:hypothetical protein